MKARLGFASAWLILAASAAWAQEQAQTVAALLKDGFVVAGVIPSAAGPGLFLHKGDKLMFCVVAETPASADVATRYCKPVR
jgi:hypothetical protein